MCIMSIYNLNVRIPENERLILEKYCERTSRSKTEVIRELIRFLESEPTQRAPSRL
jgi:Ribbon-helix-helix protein, copG family